jgi:hypothetical protein
MTSTEIIEQALADGVIVSKNGEGELKLEGDQAMVTKWLPTIRNNKNSILAALSPGENKIDNTPPPCRDCRRLEILEIMGSPVPGCLYPISEGEWRQGWKRLPEDLRICIHHH